MEEWKPLPLFTNYLVSNMGRVKRIKPEKMLTINPKSRHVGAKRDDGKQVNLSIAQAILTAFVGPKLPGWVARHLNDVISDNRLENLAWGTQKQNMQDARKNGYAPGACLIGRKLKPETVIKISQRLRGIKRTDEFKERVAAGGSKFWENLKNDPDAYAERCEIHRNNLKKANEVRLGKPF